MKKNKYYVAIICKILVIFTTFLSTIFINRGLGVQDKGIYAYIINLVEMLYLFFGFGFGQVYATYKKQNDEKARGILIFLSLVHSLIVFLAVFIAIIFKMNVIKIICILTSLAVLKNITSMIAVIEDSIKRNIIQASCNIFYLLILMILYFNNLINIKSIIIIYALNDLIRIILLFILYKMRPSFSVVSKKYLKDIYLKGFLTMIVMVLITANYSLDIIMLKNISTSIETGLYSVAVTFSNMMFIIPDALKEVLFGESTKKDFNKNYVIKAIKISIIIYFLIFLCFIIFGNYAILIMYGKDFSKSYYLTIILFIGTFFMIFFKILQPIYISNGKQLKISFFLSISILINIVLNNILIRNYDSMGAAFASLISYMFCGGIFFVDYFFLSRNNNSLMSNLGYLKYKLFIKINEKYLSKVRNKRLKTKDFTIISNNCWGAWVYRNYNLPYLSPTIGLFIMPKDYLRFINNLEYYLKKCKLKFIDFKSSKYYDYFNSQDKLINYPIGLLDDIEIFFVHYKSREEAKEKWERRVKRVNWNNLIIKFNDQNGCGEKEIIEFNKINKYKKMLCFTSKKIKGKYNIYMWEFKKDGFVIDDKYWCREHLNLNKLIEKDEFYAKN